MLTFAYFGIESSGLNLVIDLLILFVVVLYLALIYWTYGDARRRIHDPMMVGCATATSLFPFVGTLVYLVVRPPEYLEDVRERELEMQAAEAEVVEGQAGVDAGGGENLEEGVVFGVGGVLVAGRAEPSAAEPRHGGNFIEAVAAFESRGSGGLG